MIPFVSVTWGSQIHRDRKQNDNLQELGEGGMRSYCLMGMNDRWW